MRKKLGNNFASFHIRPFSLTRCERSLTRPPHTGTGVEPPADVHSPSYTLAYSISCHHADRRFHCLVVVARRRSLLVGPRAALR